MELTILIALIGLIILVARILIVLENPPERHTTINYTLPEDWEMVEDADGSRTFRKTENTITGTIQNYAN